MVVTARQLCFWLQGIFGAPCTAGPLTQTIHSSLVGCCASRPAAVGGSAAYSLLSSPPPMTSQRYHRAPFSQAVSEGRNHAQLTIVRMTVLSSAPRNSWNFVEQVW